MEKVKERQSKISILTRHSWRNYIFKRITGKMQENAKKQKLQG